MATEPLFIGVDLGTSATKAGLIDAGGTLLAEASRESNLMRPEAGRVEQDMDEIYESAIVCMEEVIEKSGAEGDAVEGIACSSQMSGIGAIDENFEPVMPYDSWLDTRCEPYITRMDEQAGEAVTRLSGCAPTYGHGPKILWWKNERPDVYEKVYKWVVPFVYVAGKLAGLSADEAYIDPSCLVFSGFSDTEARQWSDELLTEFGVEKGQLPRIVRNDEVIGHLEGEVAREVGLTEGIPIAAGAGDQAAGALGAGVVEPGVAFDVSGTASVFSAGVGKYEPDVENGVVLAMPTVFEDLYYAMAFINGGGMNLRWFRDELASDYEQEAEAAGKEIYELLDEKASRRPPGSDKVFYLPHAQGRVCPPAPNMRGMWLGFTWGHDRAGMYRSILEAIGYEYAYYLSIERELHPQLTFEEVRVLGGGAKSPFWNQMKASILGVPYRRLTRGEIGVLGDVIVAGSATGAFSGMRQAARRFVEVKEGQVSPDPKMHEFYRPYVDYYAQLLEKSVPFFEQLAELPDPPGTK